jgi:protein-arginine kinase activator protein McsA
MIYYEFAELLENAVEKEDYREAAKIRDEISKRE